MSTTVRGTFDSSGKVRNAFEDLLATGIPREEIFVEEESNEIKVMVPEVAKPEIVEILNRHNPSSIA